MMKATDDVALDGTERGRPTGSIDGRETQTTRARYDRIARFYDLMQKMNERRFAPHRAALWGRVEGTRVLEVGVGTGINAPLYSAGTIVTGIDLSPRMLAQARRRISSEHLQAGSIELLEADVQELPFPAAHFDTVVATLSSALCPTLSWGSGSFGEYSCQAGGSC